MLHTELTVHPHWIDAGARRRAERAGLRAASRHGDADRFGAGLALGLCLSAPMWLAIVALLAR